MAKLLETGQVGKREQLLDVISLVDAKKYPLTSMAKKTVVPKNTLIEYQVDSYADPSFDGVLDGEDVTSHENMAENRARLGARIQIFRRSPMVSLLAEEVSDVAGIGQKGEMAKAVAKSLEMLKRDMECAFCSDRESQAEVKPNPYRTRGLGAWIQSTAQSDLPVAEGYRTPAASINTTATSSLAESDVNAVLQSMWDQTGADKTFTLLCGRALRSRFSSFTAIQSASTNVMSAVRMFMQNAADRKIVNTIDIWEGDFGTLEILPSHWLAKDNASAAVGQARGYIIDRDLIEIAFHTAPKRKPLPDLGGGPREIVYAIAALINKNPLAGGAFKATA